MLIQTTIHDQPRENIWLDEAMLDDEDEQDEAPEEQDPDLTEAGLVSQLGLKGLPDERY